VVCGYSFGDTHVNIELDRALKDSAGQLALIVFTPDADLQGQLKLWNDDSAARAGLICRERSMHIGTNPGRYDIREFGRWSFGEPQP